MSDSSHSDANSGIGFCGALAVLFIGLKLTGYIAWSWVWVLAPLWLPLVGLVVCVVALAMLFLVSSAWKVRARRWVDRQARDARGGR